MNSLLPRSKLLFPLVVSLTILLISILVFKQYLGNKDNFFSLYYTSDLLRANLPTYTMLFDYLSNGFHYWSWEMGLGTTIFSHADVIFDPFTYVSFLGGRDNIGYMMGWLLIVKIICEGLSFSLFLNHFKIDNRAIAIASIAYAFCGYSLIMGNNLALGTILVYIPLLLLSIEKIIETKNITFTVIMLILIGLLSYYYLYITGIISIIYVIFRLNFQLKKITKPILLLALSATLSIAIISPILLPQLEMALMSPRFIVKETLWSIDLLIPNIEMISQCIARSFLPDMLGTADDKLYGDYFSGEWFVPCIAIPLISYYLYTHKSKKILLQLIGLLLLFSLPLTSFTFNAFSMVNYRWMFIIQLIICLLCAFSINDIIRTGLNKKAMIISLIIGLMILFISISVWAYCKNMSILTLFEYNKLSLITIICIYILSILTLIITNKNIKTKKYKNTVFAILMIVVITSTTIGYHDWYGESNPVAKFDNGSTNGYNGWDNEIVETIKNNDDSPFYRIYKEFDPVYQYQNVPSDNDSMMQSYYGLKCYNSMNNQSYIEFLQTMGAYHGSTVVQDLNYIHGVGDKTELLNYLGVKYYMVKTVDMPKVLDNFKLIGTYHDIAVYENTTYNQLGFINSQYMSYSDFIKHDCDERVKLIQKYTILSDISGMTDTDKKSECNVKSFRGDNVVFNVNIVDGSQYVSFSMPYDKGWHVYIDGVETTSEKINISLLGVKVSEGEHIIELKYVNETMNLGISISLITIIGCICFISFMQIYRRYREQCNQ